MAARLRRYPREIGVAALLGLLPACGLERDLEAWTEAVEHADDRGSETGTTAASGGGASGSTAGGASGSTGGTTGTSTGGSTEPVDVDASAGSTAGDESSTGPPPACGNGQIDVGEECDEVDGEDCKNCALNRVVFVTSTNFFGDLGKTHEFDQGCVDLAAAEGSLVQARGGRSFRAWISTAETPAADRIDHSPGRYVLADGSVFVDSWDDLVAGNLRAAPNLDEFLDERDAYVWTGTLPDGSAVLDGATCGDWQLTSAAVDGWQGVSALDGADWTHTAPASCDTWAALYCFESE